MLSCLNSTPLRRHQDHSHPFSRIPSFNSEFYSLTRDLAFGICGGYLFQFWECLSILHLLDMMNWLDTLQWLSQVLECCKRLSPWSKITAIHAVFVAQPFSSSAKNPLSPNRASSALVRSFFIYTIEAASSPIPCVFVSIDVVNASISYLLAAISSS